MKILQPNSVRLLFGKDIEALEKLCGEKVEYLNVDMASGRSLLATAIKEGAEAFAVDKTISIGALEYLLAESSKPIYYYSNSHGWIKLSKISLN